MDDNAIPADSLPTHWLNVSRLPETGSPFEIALDEAALTRIAEAMDLLSVEHLVIEGRLIPQAAGAILLQGELGAKVTQSCVVSLEPVEAAVEAELVRKFVPEPRRRRQPETELVFELEDEDEPEFFTGNRIDVLKSALEELSLALDPFPRKDTVELSANDQASRTDKTQDRTKPFAGLKALIAEKNVKDPG